MKNPNEPDIFFPPNGEAALANQAIMQCFGCPVRQKCEDYRRTTGSGAGVWAGKYYGRND